MQPSEAPVTFLKCLPSGPLTLARATPPPLQPPAHLTSATAAQLLLLHPRLLPALGTPSDQSANLRVGLDLGLFPLLMHKHSSHGNEVRGVSAPAPPGSGSRRPPGLQVESGSSPGIWGQTRPLLQAVPLLIACRRGPQGPALTLHFNLHAFPGCSLHSREGVPSLVRQRTACSAFKPVTCRLCETFCGTWPDSTT